MEVPERRKRSKPRKRWKDTLNEDMREKDVQVNDTKDRSRWRRLIRNSDPIWRWEKLKIKKKEEEDGLILPYTSIN